MKKLVTIFFVFITALVNAQTSSNSWIDYSKTYYKFKVATDGLYRISQSTLNNLGLGNTPAEQFQLWRNGEQVSLYTSVPTGVLPASGFIEFLGRMNDGKPDTKLYILPDYQLSDHYSLQTDTAAYFLTVNPAGGNLRYTDDANNVAGTTLTPEPYFMNVLGNYFKNQMNPGYSQPQDIYLYSSSYDIGEGWSSYDVTPSNALSASFTLLNLYRNGPNATLKFAAAGDALNQRNVKVSIFNTVIDNEPMNYFGYLKKEIKDIPLNYFLDLTNLVVIFENTSAVTTDRYVLSYDEVTYPSTFNFNNLPNFYFQLPATSVGNYLVIDNFNYGSNPPVLFDITSNKRYTGDISTPGKVKFVLPPSSIVLRKFQLCSQDPSNIKNVASVEQRNFINYSLTSNQGNYIIISNPLLYTSSTGDNNVNLYAQYRNSVAGGSYNTKVIDINELTDQFAYGIKKHPRAIKDFVEFAKSKFPLLPQYLFLIGKGVEYDQYTINQSNQYADKLNLVPTFGAPASDVSLASPYGSVVPTIAIGRLSATSGDEIGNYLQKVKEYEVSENSTNQTISNKLWTKNIANIVGGSDSSDNSLFSSFLNNYGAILSDTLFGGNVQTFSKSSSSEVQLIAGQQLEAMFNNGIGILNYFGHSSANTLAFNLSDPTEYTNPQKYPLFYVSGCTAGNNFFYDSLRIAQNKLTISENFVLAKERGSIAFLASSHFGIPVYLNDYNTQFFKQVSNTDYGNSIGNYMKKTIQNLGGSTPYSLDFRSRFHLEEFALHGDPSITLNPHAKPDYVIEDQNVKINPQFISVAKNNFNLNVSYYNIGKAIKDSITLEIKRIYPNGKSELLVNKRIKAPYYSDSLNMNVPIISTRDKGLNKIVVTIDANNEVAELSESNNSFTKEFFIYADEANPIYPANFAIINIANQKLFASTANPLSEAEDFIMEIDTTALFNSSFKISRTIHQVGGILEFDPGFSYTDNTVYYWRVAQKPASNLPADYHWNSSSFIYLSNSSEGSNQSHYYQHLASDTQNISLSAGSRQWKFANVSNFLQIRNTVFPTGSTAASDCMTGINGVNFSTGICPGGTENILIINVLDPVTLKPWYNTLGGASGMSGSLPTCVETRQANFAYDISNINGRKAAMHFLDSIPSNFYVYVRNISGPDSATTVYSNRWEADTSILGAGNSLYHQLKSQGFATIDSFYRPRAFGFIFQKNNSAFSPAFGFTQGIVDIMDIKKNFYSQDSLGYITSPQFGPAVSWKQMHWRGSSMEANSSDNPTVQIIGIDTLGNSSVLYTLNKNQQDVDISSVNAKKYPYMQLKMRNIDSVNFTPYQLSYWRLNYQTPPEGALAPEIFFNTKDTLEEGETLHFGIAFKNISIPAFDSMKIKLTIIDKNNVSHNIIIPRQKPLVSGDTITLKYDIDTKQFPGSNTIFVNFNPDNDQPEQYLFNNFIYKSFYVKSDQYNPLLDVTFDGIHILNQDIVSAKPHIIIKLKDENKTLALNDTSLLKVKIINPNDTTINYQFDNDIMKFTPANLSTGENTATIELSPSLLGQDGMYELVVSGKDVMGNQSSLDYHINFKVISKPMISNFMNYPNPFTTSTAFVFTVTGFEIPQNIRIQILTVTGKVIKEITKEELGPIHIGRNITEYKWDGTDMYGQKVGNGVYLYRVLTNLNGKSMDKFTTKEDNTDQYFTKGYGKMYLMR